jgi:hypothetical protein
MAIPLAAAGAAISLGSALFGKKKDKKQEKASSLLQALMEARSRRIQEQNVAMQLQSLAGGR